MLWCVQLFVGTMWWLEARASNVVDFFCVRYFKHSGLWQSQMLQSGQVRPVVPTVWSSARQFYLSQIRGRAPDRVIWLATLFHRGFWGEMLPIQSAASSSKVSVRRTTGGESAWMLTSIIEKLRHVYSKPYTSLYQEFKLCKVTLFISYCY
jgi:uncharacterized phage-associated protein